MTGKPIAAHVPDCMAYSAKYTKNSGTMYGHKVRAKRKRELMDVGAEKEEEEDLFRGGRVPSGKEERSPEEGRRFSLSSTTPPTPSESEAEPTRSSSGRLSGAGSMMKKIAPKLAVRTFAATRVTAKLCDER